MSAPQTNLEKQKKRHIGPLIGMALAVVFGVGMIFFWLMGEAADGQSPLDPESIPEATTLPQGDTMPTGNTP